MKPKRDQHLLVRVSAAEKAALEKAAVAADVPAAQLVRRGIKWALGEATKQKV
jgi:hypothetical protein